MKLLRKWSILILIDLLIVISVFGLFGWFGKFPKTWILAVSACVWILTGLIFGKLKFTRFRRTRHALITVVAIDVFTAVLISIFYIFIGMKIGVWGRYVIVMSVLIYFEVIFCLMVRSFVMWKLSFQLDGEELAMYHRLCEHGARMSTEEQSSDLQYFLQAVREQPVRQPLYWKNTHEKNFSTHTKIVALQDQEGLEELPRNEMNMLINLTQMNKVRHVNRFLVTVNHMLNIGGVFVSCCQTSDIRKWKILRTYPTGLNYIIYFFDYLWNRVCPKLPGIIKRYYFWVTKGQHRTFPRTEILGRLYCSGFEVKQEEYINGLLYVIAVKSKAPHKNPPPSYGPLIRLKRVGKDGKLIEIYKFRTMHAYAEYLQPYVYEHNHLQEGGKFANDYRISTVGRFLRKFWLDELPMVLNLIRGDIKLVGVRPLSQHYYSLYDEGLQELRIKTKPGLLPPFYVDMPKTLEEIQRSERTYLNAYFQRPRRTDWKYFWKIMYSIIVKRNHSA